MANVTTNVTINTFNIATTYSNISVTEVDSGQVVSNIVVTNNAISVVPNTSNITISAVAGIDVSLLASYLDTQSITLKRWQETYYNNGEASGNLSLSINNGTIHGVTVTGNVTGINFTNLVAGGGALIILRQDVVGGYTLDTTTYASNWTNWTFANNDKEINSNASGMTAISVVYDGVKYIATVNKLGVATQIQNSSLANSNVIVNGTTINLGSSGNISHFGALTTTNLTEGTNLYWTTDRGNINSNAWLTTKTTTDLSEGTNLYFTAARARGNISVTDTGGDGSLTYSNTTGIITYTGPSQAEANSRIDARLSGTSPIQYSSGVISLSGTANITTTGNISGNYFIGNGSLLTGVSGLTNAQVLTYISTQPLTVGGNLTVNGNINATGNINYQNVTDLYVTDQKITLNSNAATNANVQVIANRPTASSTDLKWNEQATRWEFTNNGTTYYPIPTSTTDLAEGSNLWFTTARANSAMDNRLIGGTGISYSSGTIAIDFTEFSTSNITEGSNLWFSNARVNSFIQDNITTSDIDEGTRLYYTTDRANTWLIGKTTTDLTEGANLYYTVGRANTAIDNRVTKTFVEGLGVSYTSLTDKPSIPTHTSNLINDSGYITTANANVISVNSKTGVVSLSTTDIPEGSNLYYTTDRANSAIGAYQGAINTAGNITTSANIQGAYVLGNGYFLSNLVRTDDYPFTKLAPGSFYAGGNAISSSAKISTLDKIEASGNISATGGSSSYLVGNIVGTTGQFTGNITTTGNISVGNIVNVTRIEGTGPYATIAFDSINPKEIILGQTFGSKIFFPYDGAPSPSVGQYLRIDSVSGPGGTLALKNFGLSYQNIGTFGNVAGGDPANITFSQSTSVVRAGLSGNVADIIVSGVSTGDTGWIIIRQTSLTPYQLTLGSSWKMEGCTTGNPVNIAQGYNEESLIFWTYDGTNYIGTVTPNIGSNVSVDIKTTGNIVGGNANITNAVNTATVNATTVNGTTVNATTLVATTANATTVNGTTVNATTLVATTANATTVNGTTVNGNTVNANTIATTAASNTVSINANVNANGNIVANSSLVTVTNGNNISLNAERNLGLLIDRNNNSANATVTVSTGSTLVYRGSNSPDRIVFPAYLEGYTDGQPVTFSGFTNATLAGALNGNVFYLRERPFQAATYDIYSNAGLTTGVNLAVGNLFGYQTGPGAVTYTRSNFVTPKEWSLNVDQLNNDLRIKEDGTTRVTVASGGNLNISGTANVNSVVISQPGTAGTYANTLPVDALGGVSPFTTGFFGAPANTFVSVYDSGQSFPTGNIFQLTFTGVTGPGNVNLNGQTFWSSGAGLDGYPEFMQLFTDSAATIPANSAVLGVTSQTGSGNVSFNFTPGSAGNNWQLSSVNGNLNIAHNGTVVGNINSAGNLTITGRHTYDKVYGEFCYVGGNVAPAATNTIYTFPYDTTNMASDVVANNTSRINITKPGIFKLIVSIQAASTSPTVAAMHFWLRKNGTDVTNSNTQVDFLKDQKIVIAMDWMVESDGDDYWEIAYVVDNTNITFPYKAAQASPFAMPAIPPIILNVIPVGA